MSLFGRQIVTASDKWPVILPDPGASRVFPSSVGVISQVQLACWSNLMVSSCASQLETISMILSTPSKSGKRQLSLGVTQLL